MTIDATKVVKIARDCVYTMDESKARNINPDNLPSESIIAEGITAKFGFEPNRLEGFRQEVKEMLALLPKQFRATSEGGEDGWSFLNACNDKDGEQWTGFHAEMELLFVLGMALGYVTYIFPRDMWFILPGGMPYLQIKLGEQAQ